MPSFHKTKETKMKEMLKRFQFNPQLQTNRQPSTAIAKQKVSEIIIRDQNGEFSSVKEKNDFNDSSWLAKLVNGIQETDNPSIRPLSQILNLQSMVSENIKIKSDAEPQGYTLTRKNSDSGSKKTGRKSVPCIYAPKTHQYKPRDNSKLSCQTITIQNEDKPQRMTTEHNQNRFPLKKGVKNGRNEERINKKFNKVPAKQDASPAHKNSLINYSSIDEDNKDFETHKNDSHEKIIIDLDLISLKTETQKEAMPIKNKVFKTKRTENKQNDNKHFPNNINSKRRTQSLKSSENYKQKVKVKVEEKELHATPVGQKREGLSQIRKCENLVQPIEEREKQVFSSHNQFLDTFKNDNIKIEAANIRPGAIKKNKIGKSHQNSVIAKLDIKDITGSLSSETRIPTFNERPIQQFTEIRPIQNVRQCSVATFSPIKRSPFIKKQKLQEKSVSTIKKGQGLSQKMGFYPLTRDLCHQFSKESPKFHYKFPEMAKRAQKYQAPYTKRINCIQLFKKLNIKGQKAVHKQNCNEEALNDEEKYQIGSIISKIKYMGKEYTEVQFVKECLKLMDSSNNCQETIVNNYQTFHPFSKSSEFKENIPFSNIKVSERKQSNCYEIQESRVRNDATFVPLFPQTLQTCTQSLAPRRTPYLQMPSLPIDPSKNETLDGKSMIQKQKSDIGIMIDSLNTKLSSYIQTNNLEDTYRKFKLEFVQLRRNMQY